MSSQPSEAGVERSVRGVNILVPSFWYEFDIHPATRDDSIRDVVRGRVRERPELAEYRGELTKTLRKLAREAWANGVVYMGAMAEIHDKDVPLLANITIMLTDARDDESGQLLPNDPGSIMSALSPIPKGRRPTDPWRRVYIADLPNVGPAARGEGVEDVELPEDQRIARMVLMQTFVPFPDGQPKVAVISAASPQLELADSMLDLFDGITSTFSFVRAEPQEAS